MKENQTESVDIIEEFVPPDKALLQAHPEARRKINEFVAFMRELSPEEREVAISIVTRLSAPNHDLINYVDIINQFSDMLLANDWPRMFHHLGEEKFRRVMEMTVFKDEVESIIEFILEPGEWPGRCRKCRKPMHILDVAYGFDADDKCLGEMWLAVCDDCKSYSVASDSPYPVDTPTEADLRRWEKNRALLDTYRLE